MIDISKGSKDTSDILKDISDIKVKMFKFPQSNITTHTIKKADPCLWQISSVIRQKGESQNWCFKKAKRAEMSEKQTFLTSSYAHVRVRIRG